MDFLSNIIDKLNKKYGTNVSDSEKLAVEPTFLEGVIQEYDKNQEFYGKILKDDDFRGKLMDLIMLDIYASFNDGKSAGAV